MNRVWRTLAIEWFEIWWQNARPYFDNPPEVIHDFIANTRKVLASDDPVRLNRFRNHRAERAQHEAILIDTALVAILDLALEDFK
jgi:hypothetical protein